MRKFVVTSLALLLGCLPMRPLQAVENVPEASLKIPPMVQEQSISTWVPSETAPGQGLAVNVMYPKKPRYPEGAPVVVVAPGGEGASGLEFTTHAVQSGFAEVRFAFPGGGKPEFASSGHYDYRGPVSQAALRDVLMFAAGKTKDVQGKTINELVPTKLVNQSIGLEGWSNGGNIAVITLAKYGTKLPFVGWLAFYETPLGAMFFPPSLGGAQDLVQNKHYREGSAATGKCLVDFRKLSYQFTGQKNPGAHKKLGQPEVPGILFFDENGNKTWEEDQEYAFPYSCDVGLEKQIYPPLVVQALLRLGLFSDAWPAHIGTLVESEKYFRERDGSAYLNEVAKIRPDLLICVFGSYVDHLQRQPDHPHITLNYNGWLSNRMKFVHLNPDPMYVASISGMNERNFIRHRPNASVDADEIERFLEPEGLVPDYVFMEAAISELADRKRAKNFVDRSLEAPLVKYWNGALPLDSK